MAIENAPATNICYCSPCEECLQTRRRRMHLSPFCWRHYARTRVCRGGKLGILDDGWWVYGLGYEIMFMRHVDALNIAICKLCFIFCRTARRIRNTRQTMRTYHTVTQPTPALPHPPLRRTHSICLLFGKCFYLCLRSFNYFCKLRCAHFRQLSGEI